MGICPLCSGKRDLGEGTMPFQDKMLTCRECGAEFAFTAGEQEFYASKGLLNEPVRCPTCRAARKSRLAPSGEKGVSQPREMFTTVCAACGKPAHVPFVPRTDRPVYCDECYRRLRQERD